MMSEPRLGWTKNLINSAYHSMPGFSSSGIDLILTSPAHYANRTPISSDALLESSAFHCLLLEPKKFELLYIVVDGTRTKKIKEDAAKEGKEVLSQSQFDNIRLWVDAMHDDSDIDKLLCMEGENEISGWWTDPETGVLCKCRPDRLIPKHRYVIDAKSMTMDNRRKEKDLDRAFSAAIVNYGYDKQANFYLRGCSKIEQVPYNTFIWLVVSKEPPYETMIRFAPEEMIVQGDIQCDKALAVYAECDKAGIWPKRNYGGIKPAEYPEWYKGGIND